MFFNIRLFENEKKKKFPPKLPEDAERIHFFYFSKMYNNSNPFYLISQHTKKSYPIKTEFVLSS